MTAGLKRKPGILSPIRFLSGVLTLLMLTPAIALIAVVAKVQHASGPVVLVALIAAYVVATQTVEWIRTCRRCGDRYDQCDCILLYGQNTRWCSACSAFVLAQRAGDVVRGQCGHSWGAR